MSFLNTMLNNNIVGSVILIVLVTGCASVTPQQPEAPTVPAKSSCQEETLQFVKPVMPLAVPVPRSPSKQISTPEIEIHDNTEFDSSAIE